MSEKTAKIYELSKSQYTKGVTCLKKVWLYNFKRELVQSASDFQEHLFTQGHEVGELAREYFPHGVLINEGREESLRAVEHTKKAIDNNAPFVFEAAFIFDKILVRVDILKRNEDGTFDLIEVKSTTSVKDHHLDDIAIQKYVLTQLGLKIKDSLIMHLNNEYVRKGQIELKKLFILTSVNGLMAQKFLNVPLELKQIRATLGEANEPKQMIGSVCKNPYPCGFQQYCWQHVTENSIHRLSRITDDKRAKLLNLGINEIKDIPYDFKLSDLQLVQLKAAKDKAPYIDFGQIQQYVADLEYPLYFLDYETIGYAIPRFDGTRPYEQVPFQYSLHVQDKPGAELRHFEYLNSEANDPRREFAESLCGVIGDRGTIIVYHSSFEKGKTAALAQAFSDLSTKLSSIVHRMWDLEEPFAKKWYCDTKFQGSSSIKYVLPVFAPELSYKDLAIQSGDTATIRYNEMISLPDGNEKEKLYEDLLNYCKRDSLAMAKILDELFTITATKNLQKKVP